MDFTYGLSAALLFGFLLGLKHATDADHVVAISTIVAERGSLWRSVWIGASWGLGHTTPLLVLGVVVLFLKEPVLKAYQSMAPTFEFGVGVMLVFLGIQVFWNLSRRRLHLHQHIHDGQSHVHIHASHHPDQEAHRQATSALGGLGRPAFRLKSYLIGIVHSLAGSAAVLLLLLPQIASPWAGLGYLLLFGIGTMVSMAAITLILAVPFALTNQFNRLNQVVASVAGTTSLVFGSALMVEVALGTSIIPL